MSGTTTRAAGPSFTASGRGVFRRELLMRGIAATAGLGLAPTCPQQ